MQTTPNVYLKIIFQNPTWVQKVMNICCFPNSKSIAYYLIKLSTLYIKWSKVEMEV